jgi:hypothetical protein
MIYKTLIIRKINLISKDLKGLESLVQMELDEEKVYQALQEVARDVPQYLKRIYNFIRSRFPEA